MTDEPELICTCGERESNGYNDPLHGMCSIHYKKEYFVCNHIWFQTGESIKCKLCDRVIYDINLNNDYEV